eukprot:TRINITY_DN9832_c0_g1_i1.p1 TRINITY_DN9832_c0_g1~~TRINITY_DN9832_c0_g1_i1.p1  ORF type:complete len:106 (-),score=14.22 TRINITY_DN9832_c0_g1_i1:155-472(-)
MFCGLHVDNGRIGGKMKTTLREIIEKYNLNVQLTPNQNIILCDIRRALRQPITAALAQGALLQPRLCGSPQLNCYGMPCTTPLSTGNYRSQVWNSKHSQACSSCL